MAGERGIPERGRSDHNLPGTASPVRLVDTLRTGTTVLTPDAIQALASGAGRCTRGHDAGDHIEATFLIAGPSTSRLGRVATFTVGWPHDSLQVVGSWNTSGPAHCPRPFPASLAARGASVPGARPLQSAHPDPGQGLAHSHHAERLPAPPANPLRPARGTSRRLACEAVTRRAVSGMPCRPDRGPSEIWLRHDPTRRFPSRADQQGVRLVKRRFETRESVSLSLALPKSALSGGR